MTTQQLDPTQWIDLYSDYLFNYTISRINDRDLAKDLVQETFYAGLKSMANFKGEASERTWLVSILKRKIIDQYRKQNSTKGQAEVRMTNTGEDNEGEWLEERVADVSALNAEQNIENTELGEAIYKCLEKLTPKQAMVFKMKTILHYETDAICKKLGITPTNLWVIIHRARQTLAECLEKSWFERK